MRPDRMRDRLQKPSNKLTIGQATAKMIDLINLYHSIDYRFGSDEDKNEAREIIRVEVSRLRKKVGSSLSTNCLYYLTDKQAWNNAKDGYLG